MIVILKQNPNREQLESLISWLQEKGVSIHTSIGEAHTILGLVGDTSKLDIDLIAALDIVEDVKRVQEPYKNANRKFHPEDTVIPVRDTQIGGGTLTIMAGPCSVESEEQVVAIAKAVKASGATMLRGGAFKPRTSPYSFQGLGEKGLEYLKVAREETGLPIVTEVMDLSQLPRAVVTEIPVLYEGEYALDLEEIARLENKTPEEIIKIHSGSDYYVYMLGFAPGHPYTARFENHFSFKRRETPRVRIPGGSIVVQLGLSDIIPFDQPCGWNIIGTTPILACDYRKENPFLLKAGQWIRHVPVDKGEFLEIKRQVELGEYQCRTYERGQ